MISPEDSFKNLKAKVVNDLLLASSQHKYLVESKKPSARANPYFLGEMFRPGKLISSMSQEDREVVAHLTAKDFNPNRDEVKRRVYGI